MVADNGPMLKCGAAQYAAHPRNGVAPTTVRIRAFRAHKVGFNTDGFGVPLFREGAVHRNTTYMRRANAFTIHWHEYDED